MNYWELKHVLRRQLRPWFIDVNHGRLDRSGSIVDHGMSGRSITVLDMFVQIKCGAFPIVYGFFSRMTILAQLHLTYCYRCRGDYQLVLTVDFVCLC